MQNLYRIRSYDFFTNKNKKIKFCLVMRNMVVFAIYQIDPLVRKVYGAESLVTVWSQEGGLVPSDGLQRSPDA